MRASAGQHRDRQTHLDQVAAVEHQLSPGPELAGRAGAVRQWTGTGALRVADLLLGQPIVDSPMLQRELAMAENTALAAINRLVEDGVLTKVSGRLRNRRYSANEVLARLDAFAARAGRRGGF